MGKRKAAPEHAGGDGDYTPISKRLPRRRAAVKPKRTHEEDDDEDFAPSPAQERKMENKRVSKRKAGPKSTGEDDEEDYTPTPKRNLTKDNQRAPKRKAGPKRTGEEDDTPCARPQHKVPVECMPDLPDDVLGLILAMLLPQEMLRFCSVSKEFSSFITHEHVLRGAVVAEKLGLARKNKVTKTNGEASRVKCILELVKQRSIFIPSPMRFLRLLCGRKCERPGCNEPFLMVQGMGVSICAACRGGFLRCVYTPKYAAAYYSSWTRRNGQVAVERSANRVYMQSRPYCTPSGEPSGALVSAEDIEEQLWKGNEDISNHVDSQKDLPGYPTEANSKRLADMYDKALENYAILDEERKLRAAVRQDQKEEQAKKTQKNRNMKKDKILKVVADVRDMLKDPWRDYALSYSWNSEWKGPPQFDYVLVQELMAAYVRAPGKATDSNKKHAAEGINEGFQAAIECGFHDFSFLSDNEKEAPFEAFLLKHLARTFPEPRLWLQKLDSQHLQHIRAGLLLEALLDLSPSHGVPQYMLKCSSVRIKMNSWREDVERSLLLAESAWKLVREENTPSSSSQEVMECIQKQAIPLYDELCPLVTEALRHAFYGNSRDHVYHVLVANTDWMLIENLRSKNWAAIKNWKQRG